jgi:hypothetical protein
VYEDDDISISAIHLSTATNPVYKSPPPSFLDTTQGELPRRASKRQITMQVNKICQTSFIPLESNDRKDLHDMQKK